MKKNEIIEVLMKRDHMTKEEAINHYRYVKEMVNEAVADGDYDTAEDIMYSELGLEMDYIFDIM